MTVYAVNKTYPCLQCISYVGRWKPVTTVAYMNGCRTAVCKGCKDLHSDLLSWGKLGRAFSVF